jgi:hypothetical protein
MQLKLTMKGMTGMKFYSAVRSSEYDTYLRELKKQQKRDRQRIFRVVEYLDYSAVFDRSPVEITDGYIISDVDSYEIFASFVFRNVSDKGILSMDITLLCYQNNQNIPYMKIPFTYSLQSYTLGIRKKAGKKIKEKEAEKKPVIESSESFGEAVYIPIPPSYFTRVQLEITAVTYDDGSREELDLIAGKSIKKFNELNDQMKFAYNKLNIFTTAEELFPFKVVPQEGELAWLCCCGHKNPKNVDRCEKCLRERDWVLENLAVQKLDETAKKITAEEQHLFKPDRSQYRQDKFLETEEEIARKKEAYELAMKRVTEFERRKEKLRMQIIPRILLYLVVALVLWFVFGVILSGVK